MDRRVTPPKRVTSPTWGPPPPCKQALSENARWTCALETWTFSLQKICGREIFLLSGNKTFSNSQATLHLVMITPLVFKHSVAWEIRKIQISVRFREYTCNIWGGGGGGGGLWGVCTEARRRLLVKRLRGTEFRFFTLQYCVSVTYPLLCIHSKRSKISQ